MIGISILMGKLSIDFVRESFRKEGYILLSENYVNSRHKLEFICSNGHKHKIVWGNWQQGNRCSKCMFDKQRLNFEFIKKEFLKEGYNILTTTYKNSHQKLNYICPIGHIKTTSWNKWQCGYRCPICYRINCVGPGHPNWQGGISCEPYCQDWTKEYKECIKERDNYTCQNPDCWRKPLQDLNIHHINYIKKDCRSENLITLCRSCNLRANYNREWHTSFYNKIIN
jgi:hypothetical protein